MSDYIWTEAALAMDGVLLGIFLMAVYDGLRLLRFFIPHKNLVTGVEDFSYWCFSAAMTFSLLFRENSGILRGYVIACVFCGMFLYDRLVSRNVFGLLKNVRGWIKIKTKQWKFQRKERKHGSKPQ